MFYRLHVSSVICLLASDHFQEQSLRLICPQTNIVLLSFKYFSHIFENNILEYWSDSPDIPQFWVGDIQSPDAFRPITYKQKYLMDYNQEYFSTKWKLLVIIFIV